MTADMTAIDDTAVGRRKRLLWGLSVLLVGAYLLLVLPQWRLRLPDVGIDGSWIATLSESVLSGRQFGRDLVYTFGPLGFAASGFTTPKTLWLVVAWGVLRALAFTAAFAQLFAPRHGALNLAAAAGFCALFIFGHELDAHLFIAGLLLLAVTARKRRAWPSPAEILLVVTLAAGALMKLLHLAGGVWVVAACALVVWLDFQRPPILPLVFALSVLGMWSAMGQELTGWGAFLRNGWELVSGYPEAMALSGPPAEIAILIAGAVFAVAVWRVVTPGRWPPRAWVLAIAACGVWFLAFKLGVVRQRGIRTLSTFQTLVVMAPLGLLLARGAVPNRRRIRTAWAAAGLCFVVLGAACEFRTDRGLAGRLQDLLRRPRVAVRGIEHLVERPHRLAWRQRAAWRQVARDYQLPKLEGPVDFFGNATAIVIGRGVDYRPRPVFQSFATYTARLVRLNGEFYRGPQAPRTVVVGLERFRGSPAGYQDSEALLEILQAYELKAQYGDLLVVERARRRELERRPLPSRRVPLGTWVSLEELGGAEAVWAEIETPKTPLGALTQAAFKLPTLRMTVRFADGKQRSFWFGSKKGAGFLLSPVINSNKDLRRVLQRGLAGAPPWRVVTEFRIFEGSPEKRSRFRRDAVVRLWGLASGGEDRGGRSR